MATEMKNDGNRSLLHKVAGVDVFSTQARFHKSCYPNFYSKCQTFCRKSLIDNCKYKRKPVKMTYGCTYLNMLGKFSPSLWYCTTYAFSNGLDKTLGPFILNHLRLITTKNKVQKTLILHGEVCWRVALTSFNVGGHGISFDFLYTLRIGSQRYVAVSVK